MKKVWAVQLDLLHEFDRVCTENGFRYLTNGGTLLGAVRHKGFIPWDDDVDVMMPRGDYERLLQKGKELFTGPYVFQSDDDYGEAVRYHSQIRNSGTTGVLKGEMRNGKCLYSFNQGIYIDIFPLDNVPDDQGERSRFLDDLTKLKRKVEIYQIAIHACRFRDFHICSPTSWIWFFFGAYVCGLRRMFHIDLLKRTVHELHRHAVLYQGKETRESSLLTFEPRIDKAVFYENKDLSELVRMPFEDYMAPVPKNYESVLTREYGEWRKHVVGASAHGEVFFDVDHSYEKYLP